MSLPKIQYPCKACGESLKTKDDGMCDACRQLLDQAKLAKDLGAPLTKEEEIVYFLSTAKSGYGWCSLPPTGFMSSKCDTAGCEKQAVVSIGFQKLCQDCIDIKKNNISV